MTIRTEINARGQEELWGEKGGKKAVLMASDIFLRLSDGHVFTARSGPIPLDRLNPHEVEMVEFWLHQQGAEVKPNVFAGEPPPDG